MAGNPKDRGSLSSRGARVQFEVAIALISILPLLTMWYLVSQREVIDETGAVVHPWAIALIGIVISLGYIFLRKYPLTVIRLRKYLENTLRGEIPEAIKLVDSGDDIRAISQCMNIILGRLKGQVRAAKRERNLLERQLYQAQKLESIGMLAAGIAHEINTPVQFVGDNAKFIFSALDKIQGLTNRYKELLGQLESLDPKQLADAMQQAEKEADLTFLKEEIPNAVAQTREGLERVTQIAAALRDFSYMGNDTRPEPADINAAIETTITISRNEWKYVAGIQTHLDHSLPLVECYPGDIKQVLIILITNAAQAIKETARAELKNGEPEKGTITIGTRLDSDHVEIRVADTGAGIPASVQPRIFDPFFTTKKPGEGTGQGLSIAYTAIVKKHGGEMTFQTEEGKGTEFLVRIPVRSNDHQETG